MQTINHSHRKLIFAMINDLALHTGYTDEKGKPSAKLHDQLKTLYTAIYDEEISLKDGCSIESFERYKDMILEYAFELDCQFSRSPIEYYKDDIEKYLIMCIKHRVCCITGQPNADIHHTQAIGRGFDRTKIDHSKYPRMALSRYYHQLAHFKGQEWFDQQYHVKGVLCQYHNEDHENRVGDIIENSNIKLMKYEQVKEIVGVRYNDGTLEYYRLTNEQHEEMMSKENSIEHFKTIKHKLERTEP